MPSKKLTFADVGIEKLIREVRVILHSDLQSFNQAGNLVRAFPGGLHVSLIANAEALDDDDVS
jgi:hypothetical protein